MKYSNYLKGKVRDQGGVQLRQEQFSAIFNLVHLEGNLKAWQEADAIATKTGNAHKYGTNISDAKEKILVITEDKPPNEFVESLFQNE